jgi:hypothetical protein
MGGWLIVARRDHADQVATVSWTWPLPVSKTVDQPQGRIESVSAGFGWEVRSAMVDPPDAPEARIGNVRYDTTQLWLSQSVDSSA